MCKHQEQIWRLPSRQPARPPWWSLPKEGQRPLPWHTPGFSQGFLISLSPLLLRGELGLLGAGRLLQPGPELLGGPQRGGGSHQELPVSAAASRPRSGRLQAQPRHLPRGRPRAGAVLAPRRNRGGGEPPCGEETRLTLLSGDQAGLVTSLDLSLHGGTCSLKCKGLYKGDWVLPSPSRSSVRLTVTHLSLVRRIVCPEPFPPDRNASSRP